MPGKESEDEISLLPGETEVAVQVVGQEPPPGPALRPEVYLSTGNGRLDALLAGGFPAGAATLLYGPPYTGKQVLQQLAFTSAASRGIPSTYILHGVTAEAMSRRLNSLEPAFADAERAGLVSYVDAYSHFIGEPTTHPNAVYVKDPNDPALLVAALDDRPDFPSGPGLIAIESASDALVDLGPTRAFHLLRRTLGRVLKTGGVGLVSLQAGMHEDSDVQMAKHLCAGMLELRKKGDVLCMHVEGLATTAPKAGWIEYEFTPHSLRITGSFRSRTIH